MPASAVEVLKEALALVELDSMDVPIVMITSQADADQSGFVLSGSETPACTETPT
jgi:hypothetical protein